MGSDTIGVAVIGGGMAGRAHAAGYRTATTVFNADRPDVRLIGPDHPDIRGGPPMDAGGVGHGVADLFVYQTRAFLDQIAGIENLGPLPTFEDGLHGLRVVAAVAESAASGDAVVKVQ
jgi:predicted dehydrogenase